MMKSELDKDIEKLFADSKNISDKVYTKTFIPDRIDGDTAGITLTTKSVVPTDTAGIGLFYDQVYVNGNEVGKLNDYIEAKASRPGHTLDEANDQCHRCTKWRVHPEP